ncbi:hypothetical protein F7725_007383 [Dissostichus mawsoni]|uniref:Uncharacterized protein n=1 Tax=Dissostichus mawsoni TaxID=36200 RepID=A0A7J5XX91_DISMA|nr:hypothetical protein F7725_007383 [Dissostichus mawsoni]
MVLVLGLLSSHAASPPQQKVGLRPGASSPGPQPSAPPLHPQPLRPALHGPSEAGTLQCQSPAPRGPHSQGPTLNPDSGSTTPVHSRSSPAEMCTPPNQKSRVKKKVSKSSAYRRDAQGDLPPPPEPPPGGERLQGLQGSMEASNAVNMALSSLERSEYSSQRKGSAHRHIENEDLLPYSSKALHLSRSQMSSNCSTTGSSSSRGSTGSRGPPSARKYTEVPPPVGR